MINRPDQLLEGGGEVSMPPTGAADCNAVLIKAWWERIYDLAYHLRQDKISLSLSLAFLVIS